MRNGATALIVVGAEFTCAEADVDAETARIVTPAMVMISNITRARSILPVIRTAEVPRDRIP
eukprot:COSAG02_NODE_2218_length_9474_cov_25.098453_1_plen_62_part_00